MLAGVALYQRVPAAVGNPELVNGDLLADHDLESMDRVPGGELLALHHSQHRVEALRTLFRVQVLLDTGPEAAAAPRRLLGRLILHHLQGSWQDRTRPVRRFGRVGAELL